ncbi:arsenate reductase ArsC [Veillonella criceti]|uniref:Arsenate reductase n=1 Tax=Veillonella criceti TaxID=103891 RepID=A0A380NLC8_9FIRM|nr:arsenate reductase ArsC [Veillonella criceti]SUP43372.1 Arsenate reductase [Veillonella criceti]
MKPKVAFVCVHNSCRSQIAEALMKHFSRESIEAYSAGTTLKASINADAVAYVKELYGIDMEVSQYPKLLDDIPPVDYIVTMGCNVGCPVLPYSCEKEDWGLEDPTGTSEVEFKNTIHKIEIKVKAFIERTLKKDNM